MFEVCFFQIGNPSGYVIHEPSRNAYQSIMISVGPFLVNSVVGAAIAFPGVLPITMGDPSFVDLVLLWLGLSVAMHAFPSTGDASSMWQEVWSPQSPVLAKLIATPLMVFIYLGAAGSVIWLDALYGIGVSSPARRPPAAPRVIHPSCHRSRLDGNGHGCRSRAGCAPTGRLR